MCAVLMELILHAGTNYDCTSEADNDFFFMGLNKRYWKDCVKHYMRKVYNIFLFTIFNACV